MQIKAPPSINGDLQEAREQRLTAFVAAGIEGPEEIRKGGCILAIARRADSPVARALAALRPSLADSGITIRIIFAEEDAAIDQFIAAGPEVSAAAAPEIRIVRNPRLRDAHEQLIIGGAAVWFGDSLRRDISRRDLFEQYLANAPEAAAAAARGFEQLWARTEPYLTLAALNSDSLTVLAGRKPDGAGPSGTVLC